MQYCVIYKTRRKDGLYLFIKEKNQFADVPDTLLEQFGTPELAMVLPLNTDKSLLRVSRETLIASLEKQGYYLQLPPNETNMLEQHRESLGLDPKPPANDR